MEVRYEWDVEEVRGVDEVEEHFHQESYAECVAFMGKHAPPDGSRWDVALVRDDHAGRSWAYIKDGELPTSFEDAYGVEVAKVPVRFVREVAATRAVRA
jgi:hypothetical protein